MEHRTYLSVLFDSHLRYVFLGQALATIASRFFDITLIWLALEASDNYQAAGIVVFFRFIPYTLLGLFGGWVSDRFNRAKVIFVSDMFRAIVIFALLLLMESGFNQIVLLSGAAFLLTSARTFFQPSIQGLLPEFAKQDKLVHANAILHGLNEISGIIAPVLAGFLLAILSVNIFLVLISVVFCIAAFFILMPQISNSTDINNSSASTNIINDYKILFQYLISRKLILNAILLNSLAVLGIGGVLNFLIPALIKTRFPNGPEFLGILVGAIALGTVLGAYATAHIRQKHRNSCLYYAWSVYGVLIICLAFPASFSVSLGIGLTLGFVGAFPDILFATIIQTNVPKEHISKTFAFFSTLANTGEALSALLLAAVLGSFGLIAAFIVGGTISIAVGILGILSLRMDVSDNQVSRILK